VGLLTVASFGVLGCRIHCSYFRSEGSSIWVFNLTNLLFPFVLVFFTVVAVMTVAVFCACSSCSKTFTIKLQTLWLLTITALWFRMSSFFIIFILFFLIFWGISFRLHFLLDFFDLPLRLIVNEGIHIVKLVGLFAGSWFGWLLWHVVWVLPLIVRRENIFFNAFQLVNNANFTWILLSM
jgi:hypothetical protein